jgi:hypothetical protein
VIVANEIVESELLFDALLIGTDTLEATEVSVVAPALNRRVRHWVSDEDGARGKAGFRLEHYLSRLAGEGAAVDGWIGDADPAQAVEDALRFRGADLIVLVVHPEARSNWLERGLAERIRARFGVPLVQIVVDGERERLLVETHAIAMTA